jgi:O-antigen ligase
MQNILKKVVWACLLIIPFIALYVASGHTLDLPNVGTSGMYFPFIAGKNLLFRLLIEVAFFGWVVLALANAAYRINIRKNPIFIAYGVFMIVLFLADIFGANAFKSFWSNFERMEGFVGHIHLFAYFVVLTAMLRTAQEYGLMWKALIASNIAVLVFGYGQLLGANGYIFSQLLPSVAAKFSTAFPIHMSENRLDATLGNSAYFAIYCLMFIFILGLRWTEKRGSRYAWMYPTLIALNLIALFYTGTRGTQIGLLVGGFITLALVAWNEKGRARKTIAGVLVVSALLVVSVFAFKNNSFVKNSPTLARFASISPNDLTGMSRLSIWKISYEAWKEHPILGYGQENFSNIYATKFIPEKMWMLESWYDRSHDVFFDWLVAAGALGLIAYLSLYVVALWVMWIRKNDMPFREKAILTGALAGYFVHNVFVFDNLISYILFFFLLAYIAFRTGSRGDVHQGMVIEQDKMNMLYAPLIGIIFLATAYSLIYRPFEVNRLLVKGLDINRLVQSMPFADAVKVQQASFEEAVALNTLGTEEAREQFLQTTVRMAQVTIPEDVPMEDKQKTVQALNDLISSARQEILNSYDAHKDDVRALSIYGMFYNGIGDGVSAEKVLTEAHTLAPKKQLVSFDLIRAYLLQNKVQEAYTLAQETYDLAPAYGDAAKFYLITAAYAKKWNEARAHMISLEQVVPFDTDALAALVSTKQTALAIQFLNELKASNPQYAPQVEAYIKQILAAPVK